MIFNIYTKSIYSNTSKICYIELLENKLTQTISCFMIKAPQYFQNQIYHFPLRASNRLCGMYNEWVWTTQSKQVSHVTSIVFKTAAVLADHQRWYTHQKKHVSRVWNPLRFYSELPAHVKREDNHCKSQIPSEASTSCRIQSGLHVLVVNYNENTIWVLGTSLASNKMFKL